MLLLAYSHHTRIYVTDCVYYMSRFELAADRICALLVTTGKVMDRDLAMKTLRLDDTFNTSKLHELLNVCKDTFLSQSYNRSQQNIDALGEYLILMQIFEVTYLSSQSTSVTLENLTPKIVRDYANDSKYFHHPVVDGQLETIREEELLVCGLFHCLDTKRMTQMDIETYLYSFFRLADPARVPHRFSHHRYAGGVSSLPRFAASAPLNQLHSPLRGILNSHNILMKAGSEVGIICQRGRDSALKTGTEPLHFSLFIPPGTGHSFVTFLTMDKGRYNCVTCLLMFLIVFYQSDTTNADVRASHSTLSILISRILAKVFVVKEIQHLKQALSDMGIYVAT
jgi:hypothetical protein